MCLSTTYWSWRRELPSFATEVFRNITFTPGHEVLVTEKKLAIIQN